MFHETASAESRVYACYSRLTVLDSSLLVTIYFTIPAEPLSQPLDV
jgi:hypothetical protein